MRPETMRAPNKGSMLALLLVVSIGAGACTAAASASHSGDDGRSSSPSAAPRSPSPSIDERSFRADDRGLILEVFLSAATVAPGGEVDVLVRATNDRTEPVIVPGSCHLPVSFAARLALPLEPAGRAWDGVAGDLKRYALDAGLGPGGVPATQPIESRAFAPDCDTFGEEQTLAPGERRETRVSWAADLLPEVPALTGAVPFQVSLLHDQLPRPSPTPTPSPLPGQGPPVGSSWGPLYEVLAVDGTLTIAGSAPRLVTAGEAVDAVLADDGFATWLAAMPSSTWSVANLYLQSGGGGIVPDEPVWSVELFREMGVPRNWAIGYVDAFTGELLGLHYCDIPCDR